MSQISTERKKLLSGVMNDLWQYIKDHDTVEGTDEYWLSVVENAGKIYNKYGQDDLVKRLVLAVVESKEAEYGQKVKREMMK